MKAISDLAITKKRDDRVSVTFKGREVPDYDEVSNSEVSPDGGHLAYAARRGKKWFAVVDGTEGPEYDAVGVTRFWFSLNGNHWAYIATRGRRQLLVVDGKEGSEHDSVYDPVFSPDGTHYGYLAPTHPNAPDEKASVVIDGKEGPVYDAVSLCIPNLRPRQYQIAQFSRQGGRSAYIGRIKAVDGQTAQQVVVLDGKEMKRYTSILGESLHFTADGAHLGYAAGDGKTWRHVVDGQESPPFDLASSREIQISRDRPLEYFFISDKSLYHAMWK
jgi:hypothetical protein